MQYSSVCRFLNKTEFTRRQVSKYVCKSALDLIMHLLLAAAADIVSPWCERETEMGPPRPPPSGHRVFKRCAAGRCQLVWWLLVQLNAPQSGRRREEEESARHR
jgi:hypothetical protein